MAQRCTKTVTKCTDVVLPVDSVNNCGLCLDDVDNYMILRVYDPVNTL
jgi:hypothetical protein